MVCGASEVTQVLRKGMALSTSPHALVVDLENLTLHVAYPKAYLARFLLTNFNHISVE